MFLGERHHHTPAPTSSEAKAVPAAATRLSGRRSEATQPTKVGTKRNGDRSR